MIQNQIKHAEELVVSGKFKKALKLVNKILGKNSMIVEAWYLRGKCLKAMGNEKETAICYQKMEGVGGNPLLVFSNIVRSMKNVDVESGIMEL
jgi:tetratricopeptide (TPR) repeat protein